MASEDRLYHIDRHQEEYLTISECSRAVKRAKAIENPIGDIDGVDFDVYLEVLRESLYKKIDRRFKLK